MSFRRNKNSLCSVYSPTGDRISARQYLVIGIIVAVYILSHAILLEQYPHLSQDEPWASVETYHHINDGVFRNPARSRLGLEGFRQRQDKIVDPFFVHKYSLYPVYSLFGTGLMQGRIWMAFIGMLVLFFTYKLARHLFGTNVAVLALALLVIDSLFFYKTRMIRYEVLGMVFSVSSIYYYLLAYDKKLVFYLAISGFLCGLAIFNHPMGLYTAISILFITLYKERRVFYKSTFLWITGACTVSVSCLFFLDNSLADLFEYRQTLGEFKKHTFGNIMPLIPGLMQELVALKGFFVPYRPLSGLVLLLAVFSALYIRKTSTTLLLIIMGSFMLWSIIFPPSHTQYYVYLSPYVAILIASFFYLPIAEFPEFVRRINVRKILLIVVLVLYVGNHFAYITAVLVRNRSYSYLNLSRQFDQLPDRYQRVLGDFIFWFHFKEKDFVSMNYLSLGQFELLDEFKPQIVVIGKRSLDWYGRERRAVRLNILKQYIASHGGWLKETIDTPYYGPIKIYRVDYPSDGSE